MKRKIILPFIGVIMSISLLSGCKQLHIHTFGAPFEHNETEHWKTCTSCGEKFMVGEHKILDVTDKCILCDYEDPIVVTDENGVMTGLTEHGKTKAIIDLPSTVLYVAKDALVDSNVLLLNLSKEFVGYYEGAFDKPNLIVKTAEEEVVWELVDGICYKHDILAEYDAKIDDVLYKTLNEAFDAVATDETTITILKDDLTLTKTPVINHIVTLETYHNHVKLNCDFNINSGGILNVPSSIDLTSNVKLMLANTREEIGEDWENVYSSGTIAFVNTDVKPENVYVEYVDNFEQKTGFGREAVGSKQVVNSVLVLPVTHYAYGTFTFSKDYKYIKGLTYYGQAVSDLYITNVVKGINAVVAPYGFSVYTDIKINIDKIKDTHITLYQTKGIFTSLHLCDGIVGVGSHAFTNETTDDIFYEVKLQISILLSRIKSLEIGDSVTALDESAFEYQGSLEEVSGGRGLTRISQYAFHEDMSLRYVDFSEAYSLTTIEKYAFASCNSLMEVYLPPLGWTQGPKLKSVRRTFLPNQFDPEYVAFCLAHEYSDVKWVRESVGHIAFTKTTKTDSTGRYMDVSFTDDINVAFFNCADQGWINVTEGTPAQNRHLTYLTFNKSISIFADPSVENVTIGKEGEDLVVEANNYITLSNVNVLSPVLLKHNGTDGSVTNTAGFAIRNDKNEDMSKINVRYDNQNKNLQEATSSKANLIRGEEYLSYGLFNFSYILSQDNVLTSQTILSSAKLGNFASRFTIQEQIKCNDDCEVIVGDSAFVNKTNLMHVVLNGHVTKIGTMAFALCTNLRTVNVVKTNDKISLGSINTRAFMGCSHLNSFIIEGENDESTSFHTIGVGAFEGCSNLEWFDFGQAKHHRWIVGITIIQPSKLEDCENAAKEIKDHTLFVWTIAV